jgi:hypothetical protein
MQEEKVKPKRVLSEKQKEAFARGRKIAQEKRLQDKQNRLKLKEMEDKDKEVKKDNSACSRDNSACSRDNSACSRDVKDNSACREIKEIKEESESESESEEEIVESFKPKPQNPTINRKELIAQQKLELQEFKIKNQMEKERMKMEKERAKMEKYNSACSRDNSACSRDNNRKVTKPEKQEKEKYIFKSIEPIENKPIIRRRKYIY